MKNSMISIDVKERAKGVFSKGLKENQLKAFKREHKK